MKDDCPGETLNPFLVEFDGKQFYMWHRTEREAHVAACDIRKATNPGAAELGTVIVVKPAPALNGKFVTLEPFKLYPAYEFRHVLGGEECQASITPPSLQDFKDDIRRIPELQERIKEVYAVLTEARNELNRTAKRIAGAYLNHLSDSYTGPAMPDRITHQGWIIDIDADMLVDLPENDIGQAVAFHRDASKTLSEF